MLAFFASLDAAGDAVARMTPAGLVPVTLELMDRATIAAVDDWHHLGLDRDAEAMLMVESDLPARGRRRRDRRRRGRLRPRRGRRRSSGPRTPRRPTGCARPAGSRCARWSGWAPSGWRTSACPRARVPAAPPGDRGDRRPARDPLRHVRARGRRQPPPELHLRAGRPRRRGADRAGPRRPLPRGAGPRRDGHGRARDRRGAARLPADPGGGGGGRRHARVKAALDPLGILNPGRVL